jgi:hypothetical protein
MLGLCSSGMEASILMHENRRNGGEKKCKIGLVTPKGPRFRNLPLKRLCTLWTCLDGGVSISLKQTNIKTNTFHPNTC